MTKKNERDNAGLLELGGYIASIWGGCCLSFEIDYKNEVVIFSCVEHGEFFDTEVSFVDLYKDYDYSIVR